MPSEDGQVKLYQAAPPNFVMGECTILLMNFCVEHEILLEDDPEYIQEFRRYQAETEAGESGRLLH